MAEFSGAKVRWMGILAVLFVSIQIVEWVFSAGAENETELEEQSALMTVLTAITGIFIVTIPNTPIVITVFLSAINTFLLSVLAYIGYQTITDFIPFL